MLCEYDVATILADSAQPSLSYYVKVHNFVKENEATFQNTTLFW